jgi:16S rRNA A1518/A1519 N6-dimethyltransferase RsmA/KsgA/DIM1 with predicted DNA glycosylase/AP lyase activity
MGGSFFSENRRAELNAQDRLRPNLGNHEANVRFIEATGLLRKHRRVLEIGCGKGHLMKYLHNEGHEVTGVETIPNS